MTGKMVRQGDILCLPLEKLPEGLKVLKAKEKIILAEGEVTGHFHSIIMDPEKINPFMGGEGKMFLEVFKDVELTHNEHATLVLVPGFYEVRRQLEFFHEEARMVKD